MRLLYLSHKRPAKAQESLRIRAVSPEPSLSAHVKFGIRRRVRPKIRHIASLRIWRMILRRTKNTIISWHGSMGGWEQADVAWYRWYRSGFFWIFGIRQIRMCWRMLERSRPWPRILKDIQRNCNTVYKEDHQVIGLASPLAHKSFNCKCFKALEVKRFDLKTRPFIPLMSSPFLLNDIIRPNIIVIADKML